MDVGCAGFASTEFESIGCAGSTSCCTGCAVAGCAATAGMFVVSAKPHGAIHAIPIAKTEARNAVTIVFLLFIAVLHCLNVGLYAD